MKVREIKICFDDHSGFFLEYGTLEEVDSYSDASFVRKYIVKGGHVTIFCTYIILWWKSGRHQIIGEIEKF